MPEHSHHRTPRCKRCGARIELLPYDGTGRLMPFDPITAATSADPDARRFVMYTDARTDEDRVRLVTASEPWDEDNEFRIKQHLLSCPKDPRNPRVRAASAQSQV